MDNISKILNTTDRLACITIDVEMDYGSRTGEFNILNDDSQLRSLKQTIAQHNVPITAFITTDLIEKFPRTLSLIRDIACDFHSHSHTHKNVNNPYETSRSADVFEKYFNRRPLGYRFPQGVFNYKDIELIKSAGYRFSSSLFPSIRPGKFYNIRKPAIPFLYKNGILELPFAVINTLRTVFSLSYAKIYGLGLTRVLINRFGLPNIVVFDSHLHDYIYNEKSFNKLTLPYKLAWGINKRQGVSCFEAIINMLKQEGYVFTTMTNLFDRFEKS